MERDAIVLTAILVMASGCETLPVATPVSTTPMLDKPEGGESASTTPMLDKPEGGERWLCQESWEWGQWEDSGPIHLVAVAYRADSIEEGSFSTFGNLSFAGTTHVTAFELQGLERRWDWNVNREASYDDALFIELDGDARYINFRVRRAKASGFFKCRQG